MPGMSVNRNRLCSDNTSEIFLDVVRRMVHTRLNKEWKRLVLRVGANIRIIRIIRVAIIRKAQINLKLFYSLEYSYSLEALVVVYTQYRIYKFIS